MRKGLWTVFSILLIAMVLTACAAPAPTATPPPAPTKAPAAAQPTAAPVQPTAAATAKPTAAPVQPTTAPAAKPWKVCMVYSGAIGDAGWNFVIDQARKKAEQKFGMQIPYVEGAAAPSDAERVMSQFAEQGCNEIFTTTNVYGDIPAKVAAKYPNVIIESEEGIVGGPPNMRIYRVPFWEPNYLLAIHAAVLRSFTSETS